MTRPHVPRHRPVDPTLDDPAEARVALLERVGIMMDSGVPREAAEEAARDWYRGRFRRRPPVVS